MLPEEYGNFTAIIFKTRLLSVHCVFGVFDIEIAMLSYMYEIL